MILEEIDSLRTWLESLPDAVQEQVSVQIHIRDCTREQLRAVAAGATIDRPAAKHGGGGYQWLTRELSSRVRVAAFADESVCTRRLVGSRIVPAVPRHEAPVYEYDCPDVL